MQVDEQLPIGKSGSEPMGEMHGQCRLPHAGHPGDGDRPGDPFPVCHRARDLLKLGLASAESRAVGRQRVPHAGLRGEIIKSDNLADIKLFAATFLSGAASALTEKQQTVFGPINSPTLNNAPFAGAQSVLQTYAQQILDSIQKNGFYVRVPSGKQFYLYVLQTIDDADASLGGTAIPVTQEKDEPSQSRP